MNAETKNALLVFAEELGEVQKEVFKAIRFGLDDTNPVTNISNTKAIIDELNDVAGCLEKLKELGVLPPLTSLIAPSKVKKKIAKIDKYFEYTQQLGID